MLCIRKIYSVKNIYINYILNVAIFILSSTFFSLLSVLMIRSIFLKNLNLENLNFVIKLNLLFSQNAICSQQIIRFGRQIILSIT